VSFKGPIFRRDHSHVRAVVCGVPFEYASRGELMQERGVSIDHSTVNRWVIKYSPPLEDAFHRRKRPVRVSWRMDETYIKIKGNGAICIGPSISGPDD